MPGLRERPHDRARAAAAGGVGLGDVVGVGGDPGAEHLGVDRAPRALACSSDSRTRTPAPSPSTKPSRPLSHGRETRGRVVVALRQRHHVRERRHRQRVDRRLGAAGDHDVGPAEPDLVEAERDAPRCPRRRPRPGCAPPARAPTSRLTCGGRAVRHQHRDGERRDPARALLRAGCRSWPAGWSRRRCRTPWRRRAARGRSRRRPARRRPRPPCAATIANCDERSRRRALTRSSTSRRLDGDPAGDLDRQVLGPRRRRDGGRRTGPRAGRPRWTATSPPTGEVAPSR